LLIELPSSFVISLRIRTIMGRIPHYLFAWLCVLAWTAFHAEARAAVIRPVSNIKPISASHPSAPDNGYSQAGSLSEPWVPYHAEFAEVSNCLSQRMKDGHHILSDNLTHMSSLQPHEGFESMNDQSMIDDPFLEQFQSSQFYYLMWGRNKAAPHCIPWRVGRTSRVRQNVPQAGIVDADQMARADLIGRFVGEQGTCLSILYISHLFRPPRFDAHLAIKKLTESQVRLFGKESDNE
jgi:hypothetical protein